MENLEQKNQIKETVNQLYALRAGLSLVDKEHDKSESAEKEARNRIAKSNNDRDKLLQSKYYLKKKIADEEEKEANDYYNYRTKTTRIDNQNADIECKIKKETEQKKKSLKISSITASIVLVCIAICIVGIWLMSNSVGFVFSMIILQVFPYAGFVLLIVAIVNFVLFLKRKSKIKELNAQREKIEKITEYKKNESYDRAIEKFRGEISETEITIKNIENKIEKYENEATNDISMYSKKGIEMYDLVVKEFSESLPSLDQRDYKHVDLIIFLLETGRAETMKEALQQVDTYVHTEKIVQAVDNASKSIAQSIRINTESLKSVIQNNTYALGEKIDRLTYNVSTMSDNQAAFAKDLNEKLAKTNSSLEMQKALLEKSSVSSAEMANNIEKMRLYADEAYIRNVNKW